KRVENALNRRIKEQGALYRFTDRLHRTQSLDDVYESALDTIFEALPCTAASILLFDEAGGMRFVASRGPAESYRKAGEGHSPWVAGETDPLPILVPDVDAADIPGPLKAAIRAEGIRALAFIPLVAHGRLFGKFMTYYDVPHDFTAEEINLALTTAR